MLAVPFAAAVLTVNTVAPVRPSASTAPSTPVMAPASSAPAPPVAPLKVVASFTAVTVTVTVAVSVTPPDVTV